MAKRYLVTCIDSTYLARVSGQASSFSVPLPEEFDTREKADAYAAAAMQNNTKLRCSVNEVEA